MFLMFAIFLFLALGFVVYLFYGIFEVVGVFKKKFNKDDFIYSMEHVERSITGIIISGACAYFWYYLGMLK